MIAALSYVVVGTLLVFMALSASVLKRLPLSAAMIYLGIGLLLSPAGAGLLSPDPVADAPLLERLAEIAVIVSLFTSGLKLRIPLRDAVWRIPVRLASVSMIVTVALVAAFGVFGLGMTIGAAVLLGAVLAPTDPVLAGDVQVLDVSDRDRLRFGLTGEAGINDGTAFPVVMLGLGFMGLHDLGSWSWRWWTVDVAWAVIGGLAIGFACGTGIARLVLYLRRTYREAVGLDNFLALGLIAFAYGGALLLKTYGFLAVFAAGLALRRVERRCGGLNSRDTHEGMNSGSAREEELFHPDTAPAQMADAVLVFNEQVEKLLEVAAVVVLGALLAKIRPSLDALGLAAALFLVIRPVAVIIGLFGLRIGASQRALISWFGVRGVGSLYYLMYALSHGVPEQTARTLADFTVLIVSISIVAHGVSVTPLMEWYGRRGRKGQALATDQIAESSNPNAT